MRKLSIFLTFLLVISLLFAACGGDSQSSNDNAEKDGSSTQADSNTSKKSDVTLKYWAAPLGTEEMVMNVWREIGKNFKEETGITLDVEMVAWGDLQPKLTTALTGGGGPDLTGMGSNMSLSFSAMGGMLPLTEERFKKIGGKERFYGNPGHFLGEADKDPVSIPLTIVNNLFFYNKELFAEAGMTEIPEKWEDFIELAQKLTVDKNGDGKIDQWGMGFYGKPMQSWKPYLVLMFQRGVDFMDDEGKLQYNSAEGLEALKFLSDFVGKYKITPPVSAEWNYDDMLTAFHKEEIASMMVANSDSIALLDTTEIKGKYAVGRLPYIWPGQDKLFDGGVPATSHAGGTNIGIVKNTKHEEEALMFLEFISRPEVNKYICDSFQSLSPVIGAYDGATLTELQNDSYETIMSHSFAMPAVPYFQPSLNIVASCVQFALTTAGEGSVTDEKLQDSLDKAVAEINESLVKK